MEKPRRVIVPLLAILLGAGILSYTVGKDFLPPLDEGAIWIQVQLPPGISIEKSKEMGAELRKTLKEFKEVSYVMTQVGRDDEGAEAFSLSHVECGVGLKPYSTCLLYTSCTYWWNWGITITGNKRSRPALLKMARRWFYPA